MANWTDGFTAAADTRPDAIAIRTQGERHSYAWLEDRIRSSAALFRRQGVAPGDRVALLVHQDLAGMIATLALARLGATSIMLRSTLPALAMETLARSCDARTLITDDPHLDLQGLRRILAPPDSVIAHRAAIGECVFR
jgi:acyl-coenzyme A synthetase/AMP-(fatty) acid ligase